METRPDQTRQLIEDTYVLTDYISNGSSVGEPSCRLSTRRSEVQAIRRGIGFRKCENVVIIPGIYQGVSKHKSCVGETWSRQEGDSKKTHKQQNSHGCLARTVNQNVYRSYF